MIFSQISSKIVSFDKMFKYVNLAPDTPKWKILKTFAFIGFRLMNKLQTSPQPISGGDIWSN